MDKVELVMMVVHEQDGVISVKLKWIIGLWVDVNPYDFETRSVIPHTRTAHTTEKVQ